MAICLFFNFLNCAKFQKDWTKFILNILQWSPTLNFGRLQKQKTSKVGTIVKCLIKCYDRGWFFFHQNFTTMGPKFRVFEKKNLKNLKKWNLNFFFHILECNSFSPDFYHDGTKLQGFWIKNKKNLKIIWKFSFDFFFSHSSLGRLWATFEAHSFKFSWAKN